MNNMIFETERAHFFCMSLDHLGDMMRRFQLTKVDTEALIKNNLSHQKKHGFSVYNVFHKETGKYIGYCGCTMCDLKGNLEVKISWDIYKRYHEDDLDAEVAFGVRNFIFRNFEISSMFALISPKDPLGMNIAEEIDMINEYSIKDKGKNWLVYIVRRTSQKFLASFGDGESTAIRNFVRDRRDRLLNPASGFKKPRATPFKK